MLEEVGVYFKSCVCGILQDQQALPSLPSFTESKVFFHAGEAGEGFNQSMKGCLSGVVWDYGLTG